MARSNKKAKSTPPSKVKTKKVANEQAEKVPSQVVEDQTSKSDAMDVDENQESGSEDEQPVEEEEDNERKEDFLKYFWALAETNTEERLEASKCILSYLQEHPSELDIQYTLKRLIRGLSSSRDAARQGFSVTLTKLIAEFSDIDMDTTFKVINKQTERLSSMKAMEQREVAFGRVFGYMALFRSGRLNSQRELVLQMLNELVALSQWKKWITELCYEAILELGATLAWKTFKDEFIPFVETNILTKRIKTDDNDDDDDKSKNNNDDDDKTSAVAITVQEYEPEQISMAIGIQRIAIKHFVDKEKKPSTTKVWKELEHALPSSILILKTGSVGTLLDSLKRSTGCFPRVHSVWIHMFAFLFQTHASSLNNSDTYSAKHRVENLNDQLTKETWNSLVEEMLIGGTHERKGTALKLFELVLTFCKDDEVSQTLLCTLITPKFMKCLISNSLNPKTYLSKAAAHALMCFQIAAPQTFFSFMVEEFNSPKLMVSSVENENDDEDGGNSSSKKSKKNKNKKNKNKGENEDMLSKLVRMEEEKDEKEMRNKEVEKIRRYIVDLFYHFYVKQLSNKSVSSAVQTALQELYHPFFVVHSYYTATEHQPENSTPKKKKKTKTKSKDEQFAPVELSESLTTPLTQLVSDPLRALISTRLVGICGHEMFSSTNTIDTVSLLEKSVAYRTYGLLDRCDALTSASSCNLEPVLSQTIATQRAKIFAQVEALVESMKAINDDNDEKKSSFVKLLSFSQLYLFIGLELLNDKENEGNEEEIAAVVDDLTQCLGNLCPSLSSDETASSSGSDEDQSNALNVLVDLLLSLLSRSSAVLRDLVKHVLRAISTELVETARDENSPVQIILDVVCSDKHEEDEEDDDYDDDDDDDDDDEFAPIDPSKLTMNNDDEDDDDDDDDDEQSDEDDDDNDDSDEANDANDNDGDIVLKSDDSIANIMMTDDEASAEREVAALANIVRQVKDKKDMKRQKKLERTTRVHFKLRVLELLEILHHKHPSAGFGVIFAGPLMEYYSKNVRNAEKQVLIKRIQTFLTTKVFKNKKEGDIKDIVAHKKDELHATLAAWALVFCSKSLDLQNKEYLNTLTEAFLFAVRVLRKGRAIDEEKAQDALKGLCTEYFQVKKTRMSGRFFDEFIRRFPVPAWTLLAPHLVRMLELDTKAKSNDAEPQGSTSAFTCSEAFRMLTALLKISITDEEDKKSVAKALMALNGAMKSAYLALVGNEAMNKKRLKTIDVFGLALCKKCLDTKQKDFISMDVASHFAAKEFLKSIQDVQGTTSLPASSVQVLNQTQALIEKCIPDIPEPTTPKKSKRKAESKSTSKKSKKKKGDDEASLSTPSNAKSVSAATPTAKSTSKKKSARKRKL